MQGRIRVSFFGLRQGESPELDLMPSWGGPWFEFPVAVIIIKVTTQATMRGKATSSVSANGTLDAGLSFSGSFTAGGYAVGMGMNFQAADEAS